MSFLVLVVTAPTFLVACSANDSSASKPSASEVPTTQFAPIPRPSAADLKQLMPALQSLEDESFGVGGEYQVVSENEVSTEAKVVSWVKGFSFGYRREYEFLSVNEDDPMKVHTAEASLFGLVFRSEAEASASVARYEAKVGKAVRETSRICGGNRRSFVYDMSSQKLGRISEVMTRMGSFVGWMIYRDNVSLDWRQIAFGIVDEFALSVVREFPTLSSSTPPVPAKVTSSILRTFFPDREYVQVLVEGSGMEFGPMDDKEVDPNDKSLSWAEGVLTGRTHVMTAGSGDRPGSAVPRLTATSLVFESSAAAAASMARYEEQMAQHVYSANSTFEGRWGAVMRTTTLHVAPSMGDSPHVFEGLHHGGSIITWVRIEAADDFDWNSVVYNVAKQFAGNIFDFDGPLAC